MATDSLPFPLRLLTAAALCGGALLLIAARTPSPSPIYSMAAVQAGLIRSPGAWVGRTIRVRAVASTPCVTWMSGVNPTCISWRPALLDLSAASGEAALPLRRAPQSPLLAALRRLTLARWLVAAPQQVQLGVLTTYRVLLQTAPSTVCGAARCYEALLLDAAPDTL